MLSKCPPPFLREKFWHPVCFDQLQNRKIKFHQRIKHNSEVLTTQGTFMNWRCKLWPHFLLFSAVLLSEFPAQALHEKDDKWATLDIATFCLRLVISMFHLFYETGSSGECSPKNDYWLWPLMLRCCRSHPLRMLKFHSQPPSLL